MRNPSPALASGSGSVAAGKVAPCCSKVGLKKGAWTPEEDELLASFVRQEGEGKWRTLPKRAGLLRCGKSCRLRWMNYLRPSVKRGQIAPDEEDLILRLHRLLGNRWSLIAGRLPGRTDNEIKNYWNSHLSKKLIGQGIDPRTHKPLNTNKPSSSVEKDNSAHASPVPAVNPNPIPNVLLQKASSSLGHQDDGANLNTVIQEDHYNLSDRKNNLRNRGRWHSSDGTTARAWPCTNVAGDAVEISDMDCCTDDVLSSFLDSLINDDMFQQSPENNVSICSTTHNVDLAAPLDASVSEDPTFGDLSFLEPAAMYSTTLNNEGNYKVQSANHMDKQH